MSHQIYLPRFVYPFHVGPASSMTVTPHWLLPYATVALGLQLPYVENEETETASSLYIGFYHNILILGVA